MGLLDRLRAALRRSPYEHDPEADERRHEAATRDEPSSTPDEPHPGAPDDEDWLSERERLGPGV